MITYALMPSTTAVSCTWITSFARQQSVLSPTQNDSMELLVAAMLTSPRADFPP